MLPPYALLFIFASSAASKVYLRHPTNRCKFYQEMDCPDGTKWGQDKKRCEELPAGQTCPIDPRHYGAPCDVIHLCAGNLECVGGKCACAEGSYLVKEDTCAPQVDRWGHCHATDQCSGANVQCVNSLCRCVEGFTQGINTCVPSYLLPRGSLWANSSTQVMTSPGYPESYLNNLHIAQKINSPRGKRVRITFTDCDLEENYDYVEVFDHWDGLGTKLANVTGSGVNVTVPGVTGSGVTGPGVNVTVPGVTGSGVTGPGVNVTGPGVPRSFTSSGPVLFIVFHSDHSDRHKGFRATFIAVS